MKIEDKKQAILMLILVISLLFFVFENINSFTGYATEGSTPSNVSITYSLAITFSPDLSDGILFGEVNFLPATNINGSHNYDGVQDSSKYYINVSSDGNSAVDFCIKANTDLTSSSSDVIVLGNETYTNSTFTNLTFVPISYEVPLTTDFVSSGSNVPLGGVNYWRFYLDVPSAQPSGTYNNSLTFKGVATGNLC